MQGIHITEYNKDGYITNIKYFDDKDNLVGEAFITYNDEYANEDVKITYKYEEDGSQSIEEIYYDKDNGKWVNTYQGEIIEEKYTQTANIEIYTDDLIGAVKKSIKKEAPVSFKGEYTKYTKDVFWLEGYYKTDYEQGKYIERVYVKRQILDYW